MRPGDRPKGWIVHRRGVVERLPEEAEGRAGRSPGTPAPAASGGALRCLSVRLGPAGIDFHFHLVEQSEGRGVREVLVL